MNAFGLAVANLKRDRLRALVTILSVAVTIGTTVVTATAMRHLQEMEEAENARPRLVVVSPKFRGQIPFSWTARVSSMSGVEYVSWVKGIGGAIENGPGYRLWGVSENYNDALGPRLAEILPAA